VKQSFGVLVLTVVVLRMLPCAAAAPSGREVRFYPDPENGVLWVVGVLPEQPNGDIEIIYNGHPYTRISKLQVTIPYYTLTEAPLFAQRLSLPPPGAKIEVRIPLRTQTLTYTYVEPTGSPPPVPSPGARSAGAITFTVGHPAPRPGTIQIPFEILLHETYVIGIPSVVISVGSFRYRLASVESVDNRQHIKGTFELGQQEYFSIEGQPTDTTIRIQSEWPPEEHTVRVTYPRIQYERR
jgi:hypothetical protein